MMDTFNIALQIADEILNQFLDMNMTRLELANIIVPVVNANIENRK